MSKLKLRDPESPAWVTQLGVAELKFDQHLPQLVPEATIHEISLGVLGTPQAVGGTASAPHYKTANPSPSPPPHGPAPLRAINQVTLACPSPIVPLIAFL